VDAVRVLIAEDAPTVRRALCALLSAEPSVRLVGAAEDAVEAIELTLREKPDVVLLDVKMPGGGGPHAVREIRRLAPSTVVVVLSAHDDHRSVLEMLHAGAADYIIKGSPAEEILRAIGRWRNHPSGVVGQ
jgi:DNA-binding NarL/FixJ family response regulator